MGRAYANERPSQACEIVDFDAAMFGALGAETRADLIREAELLAIVFAPGRTADDLHEMARQLSNGARDSEMARAHARRLAAALKQLAGAPAS